MIDIHVRELSTYEILILVHELVISTRKLFTAFWLLGKATLGNMMV